MHDLYLRSAARIRYLTSDRVLSAEVGLFIFVNYHQGFAKFPRPESAFGASASYFEAHFA